MEITVETISQDGAHRRVSDKDLAEYKELAPELVHAWQFTAKPLTAGMVRDADKELNADKALYRADGSGNQEALMIARAIQILLKSLTAWGVKTDIGDPVPITKENIEGLPPDVLLMAASAAEFPKIPALDELKARKKG